MRKGILILLLLAAALLQAQERLYTDPLKVPLLLSGSFAELRSNHFHSGIDFKTQGVTGLPVYAVADGYISRIAVSPTGYGNALYIDHPNGTTSVYGHLQSFSPEIGKYVKEKQYENKSFRVDLTLPPYLFPVKQDQEIAKSGNSGSSGGPHLHFELRDTRSEEPLNPLEYGFSVVDNTPPKFFSLLVVPLSDTSQVDLQRASKSYPVVFYDGKYHLKNNPVKVYGEVGFAVQVNDYFDGTYNKCGIIKLSASIDGETSFAFQLNRFSFDNSRYINSHIDYEEYQSSKRRFVKTWVDPGNLLPVYAYNLKQGIVEAGPGTHQVEIEIEDSHGNKAELAFKIEQKSAEIPLVNKNKVILMPYNRDNSFESEECELEIPKGALYKNLKFTYSTRPTTDAYSSDFQLVASKTVPLQTAVTLRIKPRNLDEKLQSKAVVVNVDSDDGSPSAVGGTYKKGWIETDIRTLGTYALMVDTVAPEITPLSLENGALTESSRIRFKLNDDLSGIKSIDGYLDDKWALFEYDAKSGRITHYFDKERFELGRRHNFRLVVTDYRDNTSVYKASFWK
ncbi:M23 family metallopeptidase [Maribellus sediminis]|uniref:M23 family metallopeptidase n=1 Tax=Maribellus sediminis TaxID=2696285 RepID=UPI00143027E5|nr:M23 family metallopeptidase [Maribellus sediminis]